MSAWVKLVWLFQLEHHNEIQHVFQKVSEILSEEDLKTLLYVNPELVNQAIEEKHLLDNIFYKKP